MGREASGDIALAFDRLRAGKPPDPGQIANRLNSIRKLLDDLVELALSRHGYRAAAPACQTSQT